MSKVTRVKYFTKEKKALISDENRRLYNKYLQSNIIKNRDVKETTYLVYENNFTQFMVYLAENYENIGLYDEDFLENAVDILEGFIAFCQDTLKNNKKAINNKLAAISSFYVWSLKRKLVPAHPFDKQLDRMKGAQDEQIISSYYLDEEQTNFITEELKQDKRYDFQDRLIWGIMLDSANRVGAISKLTLTSLNLDEMAFEGIREKRGKMVEVVFEEYTKSLIEEWLEMRKEMDNLEVDSLLITKFNGAYRPMTKDTIQARVKKIGRILGIEDFRSHCIRKSASNQIYEATGDITLASEMLNHNSIETTRQSYIKPKTKQDVKDKIAKLKEERRKKKEEEALKQVNNHLGDNT